MKWKFDREKGKRTKNTFVELTEDKTVRNGEKLSKITKQYIFQSILPRLVI